MYFVMDCICRGMGWVTYAHNANTPKLTPPVGILLACECFVVVLHPPIALNSLHSFCRHFIVSISC